MIEPLQIIEDSDSSISIQWSDGSETTYTAPQLRRSCPCASCVNEWTGEKMLRDESVADDLKFDHISIVGRYALNFHFTDGHDTGIFSFVFLRIARQGYNQDMHERDIFDERQEIKKANFSCPNCRERNDYDVRWIKRTKKKQAPRNLNEHELAQFAKSRDYMVRVDDMLMQEYALSAAF